MLSLSLIFFSHCSYLELTPALYLYLLSRHLFRSLFLSSSLKSLFSDLPFSSELPFLLLDHSSLFRCHPLLAITFRTFRFLLVLSFRYSPSLSHFFGNLSPVPSNLNLHSVISEFSLFSCSSSHFRLGLQQNFFLVIISLSSVSSRSHIFSLIALLSDGYYVAYKPITLSCILFMYIEMKFIHCHSYVIFAMKSMSMCNDYVNYDEIII